MGKKQEVNTFSGETVYWLAPLILILWVTSYLYFVSSSQTPSSLSNYEEDLQVRQHVLRNTLSRMTKFNPSAPELEQIYNLITSNEICLNDLPSAEKHLCEAIELSQSKPPLMNMENMAIVCLQNANLCRDLNKFNLARVNYERSLQYLEQIPLTADFNETALKTAAADCNNLGVLNFLIGQKTIDLRERESIYLKARDYFSKAKQLMYVIGPDKYLCFQQNINDNLNRCLLEMQFSN